MQFVVPGLTRKERKLLAPVVFGSSILFFAGLAFAYYLLIPAALNFFISYGGDVVEQSWSIDNYFKFVLLLMFCTGITFQIPVIQLLLGQLNLVSSQQMLSGWRIVILGAVIIGAIVTPSTDPPHPIPTRGSRSSPLFWWHCRRKINWKINYCGIVR